MRRPQTPAPRRYLRSSRSRRLPFEHPPRQGPDKRKALRSRHPYRPLGPRPRNDGRETMPDTLLARSVSGKDQRHPTATATPDLARDPKPRAASANPSGG